MNNEKSVFIFTTRVVAKDPDGYYCPKWNEATPVDVFARNADEACRKAIEAMGKPPSSRVWAVAIDSSTEVKQQT